MSDTPEKESAVPSGAGWLGRAINRVAPVFAAGFLLSMAVLILEIVLRYVFDAPTLWAHETTTFLCAVGFIFGGLYCASHNKHIRVVLIYDALPPKWRRRMDCLIYLGCALSTGFFSYAAWLVTERAILAPGGEWRMETSGSAWNPPTPALLKMFLLLVLVVLTLQFLVLAWRHLRKDSARD